MNPSEIYTRVLEQARAAYVLRADDKAERVVRALHAVAMPLQALLRDGHTPLAASAHSLDDRTWAVETVHALAKAAAFTDEVLSVAFDKLV